MKTAAAERPQSKKAGIFDFVKAHKDEFPQHTMKEMFDLHLKEIGRKESQKPCYGLFNHLAKEVGVKTLRMSGKEIKAVPVEVKAKIAVEKVGKVVEVPKVTEIKFMVEQKSTGKKGEVIAADRNKARSMFAKQIGGKRDEILAKIAK